MRFYGFSSFVLDPNPIEAIKKSIDLGCEAIELSALREHEFNAVFDLVKALRHIKPEFEHVSVHLPKKLEIIEEISMIALCKELVDYSPKVNFILHPDVIKKIQLWLPLQTHISLENLDYSKHNFSGLPYSNDSFYDLIENTRFGFCLDIGHALQVCRLILKRSGMYNIMGFLSKNIDRLTQVHISSVDGGGKHRIITDEDAKHMKYLFRGVQEVPVIIESPVKDLDESREELEKVRGIFDEKW